MKKINKEISELIYNINQVDLIDICRLFHPTEKEYTFFSAVHRTFCKIDHIPVHKSGFIKYERIQKNFVSYQIM